MFEHERDAERVNIAHQVGGVYTAIHAFLDPAKTRCSPVPSPSNDGVTLSCAAFKAPRHAQLNAIERLHSTFNRYFDDIIVKR
jgi:hypothetical protein